MTETERRTQTDTVEERQVGRAGWCRGDVEEMPDKTGDTNGDDIQTQT